MLAFQQVGLALFVLFFGAMISGDHCSLGCCLAKADIRRSSDRAN